MNFDYNQCLGDTVMEKFETIYVMFHNLYGILDYGRLITKKWVIVGLEWSEIFGTSTCFYPASKRDSADPVDCIGNINSKWLIYKSLNLEPNMAILGSETEQGEVYTANNSVMAS